MKKVITCAIVVGLSLSLSQVTIAKEHQGPKSNQANAQRHSVDRGAHQNNRRHQYNNNTRGNTRENTRNNQRHVVQDNHRRYDDRNRHGSRNDYRHDRRHDRRDYGHRHSDSRGHDYHYRDRYRNHYRPHNYGYYRSYDHWRRYNSHPVSVYYLGQDWYYYGGYYHPYARGHMHSRHCHHRYWEPLAAGIVLGAVLGW